MPRLLALAMVLAGSCANPPALSAGEREDALALIDKAIKAHGGEAALARAQNAVRKGVGVIVVDAKEVPFTEVVCVSLPGKLRQSIEVDRRGTVVTVINGNQGWRLTGGAVGEMGAARGEVREEANVWYLSTLVPLKKDGFVLGRVDEIMLDGKPTVGVKAAGKGYPEVRLYFDKTTGVLVKLSRSARLAGQVVSKDYLYAGHKMVDGALLWTEAVELINDRKYSELKKATWELRKPDDSQFNRP